MKSVRPVESVPCTTWSERVANGLGGSIGRGTDGSNGPTCTRITDSL